MLAIKTPRGLSPITPAAADRHIDQAKDQIDEYEKADLVELRRSGGIISRIERRFEPLPWRKIKMQEDQDHDDPDRHHRMNIRASRVAAEKQGEASDEQQDCCREDPRKKSRKHA